MPGVPVSGVHEALVHLGQVELGWALERWAGPRLKRKCQVGRA